MILAYIIEVRNYLSMMNSLIISIETTGKGVKKSYKSDNNDKKEAFYVKQGGCATST